jgi:redox-sensing transcriptional repressor
MTVLLSSLNGADLIAAHLPMWYHGFATLFTNERSLTTSHSIQENPCMAPDIPDIVIGRLPLYLRELSHLAQEGQKITSSQELGQRLGISSAQIRKDLSHFGEFGKQGTGYDVQFLSQQLQRILHVDREWEVVLVGAGDLGHALARYGGFAHRGFRITHIFDSAPDKIGTTVNSIEVLHIGSLVEVVREAGIRVAMIAVPAEAAQKVTDMLVETGIRAILNYAPIALSVPKHVHVQHIDPVTHMQHMTFYLE